MTRDCRTRCRVCFFWPRRTFWMLPLPSQGECHSHWTISSHFLRLLYWHTQLQWFALWHTQMPMDSRQVCFVYSIKNTGSGRHIWHLSSVGLSRHRYLKLQFIKQSWRNRQLQTTVSPSGLYPAQRNFLNHQQY